MALIKGEKVYRNLQEQVYENTCDIKELLRMYGYHGPYTSTDVIPNDDLYNRAMYLIGTGMPYKVYQYNDLTKRFTYIGDYNMDVGPEGPPGPQGPQGERGPDGKPAPEIVNIETYDVVYKQDVTESKVRANFDDGHSNEFSVYAKNGSPGPEGPMGPQGPQGPQGEPGPAGEGGITGITVNGNTYEPVDGDITIPDYPTKTSELTNDSDFITSSALTGLATETYANNAANNAVNGLDQTLAQVAKTGSYSDLSDKPDLTVYELKSEAFSGDYNDLTNKPIIPTVDYPVTSVNSKTGDVVLSASDIKADDQTTIQENIDRIDDDIATIEGNIPDITPLATKEEVTAVANDLSNHTSNDTIHVTASDKETWSNKVSQDQIADMATKTELGNYVTTDTLNTTVSSIDNKLTTELAKKQDVITDLDTIRSGALAGSTAVQPATLDDYAKKTDIPDVSIYATTDSVNTAVSDINNNKLDKVTTAGHGTQYTRVYTIDNNGNQTITNASVLRGNNCIVTRDANAQINVPDTPTKIYHATSKKYVDDTITASTANMVTTDTDQTITGKKTFNAFTRFNSSIRVYGPGTPGMVEGSAVELSSTSLKI